MEAQLAQWVKENNSRLPIIAFMAGKFMDDEEMQGMSFGHAGTIVEGKEDSATEKIARLEAAGIPVVQRIDEIPELVKAKIRQGRPEGDHSSQDSGPDAPRR
jgi:succinyl-CoA synthetase alpha subunit